MFTDFLQYLEGEKRYSAHTLRAYRSDLEQLAAFWKLSPDELGSLSFRQLRQWYSDLMQQGMSSRSVNRKISSASAFFRFLVRNKKIAQNPVEKIINPKNKKRLPYFYQEEQLNNLLNRQPCSDDYEAMRNHCMIELFYGTGMRCAELTGLQMADIDLYANTVKVLGKGNKERIIPLSPRLHRELGDYTACCKKHFECTLRSPLFRTKKGDAVYPQLVYRVVHKSLEEQGVSGKKSPHVLRHSFATHLLNHGADLNSIKDLLGHASLSATQIYTHNNIQKLLTSYRQAHPHA